MHALPVAHKTVHGLADMGSACRTTGTASCSPFCSGVSMTRVHPNRMLMQHWQRRGPKPIPAISPEHLVDGLKDLLPFLDSHTSFQGLIEQLPLAYERVALPCSTMNCGDVIYRR
jgi:hypothetical protein